MKGNATKLEELRVATQRLNAAVNAWSVEVGGGSGGNPATDRLLRQQIALAATSILTAVKDPAGMGMEAISQVTVITANRIFWEWGVFDGIPTDEDSGITYAELATMVNADASLLGEESQTFLSQWTIIVASNPANRPSSSHRSSTRFCRYSSANRSWARCAYFKVQYICQGSNGWLHLSDGV